LRLNFKAQGEGSKPISSNFPLCSNLIIKTNRSTGVVSGLFSAVDPEGFVPREKGSEVLFWAGSTGVVEMTKGDSNRLLQKNYFKLRFKSGNSPNLPLFSKRNIDKNRSTSYVGGFFESDAPTEIRTPVLALKGLRPSPLDDGGEPRDFTTAIKAGQGWCDFGPF
jgi:hypothetical protein